VVPKVSLKPGGFVREYIWVTALCRLPAGNYSAHVSYFLRFGCYLKSNVVSFAVEGE
jgi:hypothetical protein